MTTLKTRRKRFFMAYAMDGTGSRVKWEKRHKKLFSGPLPFFSMPVFGDNSKIVIRGFNYRTNWRMD